MLDIKLITKDTESIQSAKEKIEHRGYDPALIDELIKLNDKRKHTQAKADKLRNERKILSKEIGALKSKGESANERMAKVKAIKISLETLEKDERDISHLENHLLLSLPNLPQNDVPIGKDENYNLEVKKWGEIREFDFQPQTHNNIGENLNILDFERGAKIAGHGFILYKNAGASLERALINFMLDIHINNGYNETYLPFLVNKESLIGTGQLPKFEDDLYKIADDHLYLNPTAEVALANIYRDETLTSDELPIRLTAYAPSFRKEAGSYGKDTKGLIRVHQFNKVELVTLCEPENSQKEHEAILKEAEQILQLLNLPYRVVCLSTGDMGFAASKCYDIEVWLPGLSKYKEISSVSNCLDFQSRRANIRYKLKEGGKPEFVHTLNGSGLAVGRTMVAILENYQDENGHVKIPDSLIKYMNGLKII